MILSARWKTNFINLFLIDVYWNIIIANYLLTNRLGTVYVSLRTENIPVVGIVFCE